MAQHSLGKITIPAAGTLVRITTNLPEPTKWTPAQTIMFQQLEGNSGKIYICSGAAADKTTLTGVLAVIPAPTLNEGVAVVLPYAAISIPSAPAALNAADFYLDTDVNDDGCLVSIYRN